MIGRTIHSLSRPGGVLRTLTVRRFSRGVPLLASEIPRNPLEHPKIQAFQDQLQNNPEALNALIDMTKVIKAEGFDMTTPPSPWQMAQLAMNSQVRQAMSTMMTKFKEAGINLDPEAVSMLAERAKSIVDQHKDPK